MKWKKKEKKKLGKKKKKKKKEQKNFPFELFFSDVSVFQKQRPCNKQRGHQYLMRLVARKKLHFFLF